MIELKKDPGDRLPYGFDFSPWLDAGETITDSAWSVFPTGALVLEDEAVVGSGTATSVWIHGGVDSVAYIVTNMITTTSAPLNKIKVQSFILLVKAAAI